MSTKVVRLIQLSELLPGLTPKHIDNLERLSTETLTALKLEIGKLWEKVNPTKLEEIFDVTERGM